MTTAHDIAMAVVHDRDINKFVETVRGRWSAVRCMYTTQQASMHAALVVHQRWSTRGVFQTGTTVVHKYSLIANNTLTTMRLLFAGWKRQQSNSAPLRSSINRRHLPDFASQNRAVWSRDDDTTKSPSTDQSKSEFQLHIR